MDDERPNVRGDFGRGMGDLGAAGEFANILGTD
jgi:hypothetical protein